MSDHAAAITLRLRPARMTDNELILFDHERHESWILYPPRSRYTFLNRPLPNILVVEHRSWSGQVRAKQHLVRLPEGCVEHGIGCGSQPAIQAAVALGWDPFA